MTPGPAAAAAAALAGELGPGPGGSASQGTAGAAPGDGTATASVAARSLARGMGLRNVATTSVGLAFAAIEYLAAASLVAYVTGALVWVSVAVAGLFALVAWACFGELTGLFPTAAAIRRYLGRSFNDDAALAVTLTYLSTIVLVLAADAYIVGSAIGHALGGPRLVSALAICVLIGAATLANLRGLQVATRLQDASTVVVLGATVLVAVAALLHRGAAHPVHPAHPGPGAVVQAVALGVLLYSAFEWVTTNAEEVRVPRDVPRGMLIALGVLCVACALVATAMAHLLPHDELTSSYPQLFLGRRALGSAGFALMAVVTGVTAVNTFNSGFITASRFVYATAREGSLPPALGRLNDRLVPWLPVVGLAAVSGLVAIVVAVTGAFQVLLSVGATLECLIYGVAAACVWRLRHRQPQSPRPFRVRGGPPVFIGAIVVFGVLSLAASLSVNNRADARPLLITLVLGAAATAYVRLGLPRVRAAAARQQATTMPRRPRRPPLDTAEKGSVITQASAAATPPTAGPAAADRPGAGRPRPSPSRSAPTRATAARGGAPRAASGRAAVTVPAAPSAATPPATRSPAPTATAPTPPPPAAPPAVAPPSATPPPGSARAGVRTVGQRRESS